MGAGDVGGVLIYRFCQCPHRGIGAFIQQLLPAEAFGDGQRYRIGGGRRGVRLPSRFPWAG